MEFDSYIKTSWENPENTAALEWAEGIIRVDLESCSNAVLNMKTIKGYKSMYGYGEGLGEHKRALAIVGQLWVEAFKQFKFTL